MSRSGDIHKELIYKNLRNYHIFKDLKGNIAVMWIKAVFCGLLYHPIFVTA